MPRFSLKKLFVSLTLIAIGIPTAMWGAITPEGDFPTGVLLIAFAFGGALVGIGALIPFNRPVLGAVLGPVILFALGIAYLIYQAMQPK
jgi:hypothetical protein